MWQGLSSTLKFQKRKLSVDGEHSGNKEESHPSKKQKDVAAQEPEVFCVEDVPITDERDGDESQQNDQWVNFNRKVLSIADRETIVKVGDNIHKVCHIKHFITGLMLNDKHINYSQEILKAQFKSSGIVGLQSTLFFSSQTSTVSSDKYLQIIHCRQNH